MYRGILFGLAFSWMWTGLASAHEGLHAESLRGLLKADALYLIVSWDKAGGDQARLTRQRADSNRDGHLDKAERQAFLKGLEQSALQRLRVVLDGANLTPWVRRSDGSGLWGPTSLTGPISASFQLRFDFVSGGGHELKMSMEPTGIADHVPTVLQLDPGMLLKASNGRLVQRAKRPALEALLGKKRVLVLRFGSSSAKQSADQHP